MRSQERRQARDEVQARESYTTADAQTTCQAQVRAKGREIRFVSFVDHLARALVIDLPGFSRCQAMCRPHQQTHTEPIFELRNGLRNRGLTNV